MLSLALPSSGELGAFRSVCCVVRETYTFGVVVVGFVGFVGSSCRDSYDPGDSCLTSACRTQCSSLLVCLFTTFDQGFKNDGGVGGYLHENLYEVGVAGPVSSSQGRAGLGAGVVTQWLRAHQLGLTLRLFCVLL